jgi:hypothetical protein
MILDDGFYVGGRLLWSLCALKVLLKGVKHG